MHVEIASGLQEEYSTNIPGNSFNMMLNIFVNYLVDGKNHALTKLIDTGRSTYNAEK